MFLWRKETRCTKRQDNQKRITVIIEVGSCLMISANGSRKICNAEFELGRGAERSGFMQIYAHWSLVKIADRLLPHHCCRQDTHLWNLRVASTLCPILRPDNVSQFQLELFCSRQSPASMPCLTISIMQANAQGTLRIVQNACCRTFDLKL